MSVAIKDKAKDILTWKRKYGDIYLLEFDKGFYIFRTLTRGEYLEIVSMQNSMSSFDSDYFMELCLLYPQDQEVINNSLAGEVERVKESIIELSGFADEDKFVRDLENARKESGILDNQVIALLCKAFPHMSLKSIDQLNYQEILKHIVIAESMLDVKLNIEKPQDTQSPINFEQENKDIVGGRNSPPK